VDDAHPPQDPHRTASEHSRGFWIERIVGLGLVFVSLVLFYAMAIPSLLEPWVLRVLVGAMAVIGVSVGFPLLVTGRVRQTP
jgi:hypothetical protein